MELVVVVGGKLYGVSASQCPIDNEEILTGVTPSYIDELGREISLDNRFNV